MARRSSSSVVIRSGSTAWIRNGSLNVRKPIAADASTTAPPAPHAPPAPPAPPMRAREAHRSAGLENSTDWLIELRTRRSACSAPRSKWGNAMLTGEQYKGSLFDGRSIFFEGKRVDDLVTHPFIGPCVQQVADDYDWLVTQSVDGESPLSS